MTDQYEEYPSSSEGNEPGVPGGGQPSEGAQGEKKTAFKSLSLSGCKQTLQGCSHASLILLVMFESFLLLIGFVIIVGLVVSGPSAEHVKQQVKGYTVEVVRSGDSKARILLLDVEGILGFPSTSGLFGGGDLVGEAIRKLEACRKDGDVRAVLMRVNSPGGLVTASDRLHHAVVQTRDSGKKMVVYMKGLAASGGYYISAPADRIVAQPTTITGSIGVIWESFDLSKLLQKIGVENVVVRSGDMKGLGSIYKPMTDEERAVIQELMDTSYGRFVALVAEGRKMDVEKVKELADGRPYSAERARELGLIDSVGYFEDAVSVAEELAGISNAEIIRYKRWISFVDILQFGSLRMRGSSTERLVSVMREYSSPRLMYLWSPGQY